MNRKMQRLLVRDLSITLDLVAMGMQAGLDFGLALERVVRYGPQGPLSHELRELLRQMSLGQRRVAALESMQQRLQLKELRGLICAINISEALGGNLAGTLQTHAQAIRQARFHAATKQAQQIPVKMIFPLVLCIFPCIFLVLFGPVLHHLLTHRVW